MNSAAPCNGFAGALRSAQRLMGLYPLWWRGFGDVFSKPANGSAVAPEHQSWKAHQAGAAVEVYVNPTEGGIVCKRHILCAGASGSQGFIGSRALRTRSQILKEGGRGESPEQSWGGQEVALAPAHLAKSNKPSRDFRKVFRLGPEAEAAFIEAPCNGDTPQGSRGGAENNPIKSVRMSHTPAVPPSPLATADDIGSGVMQAIKRERHKRFLIVVEGTKSPERSLTRGARMLRPRRRWAV